jgi:signal transduction histidine kinase
MSIFVLMKKLHLSRNLMVAAILLIVAFQCYWLAKLYKDEYSSLKKEVDVTFRETIYKLQKQRFEKDTLLTGTILNETGLGNMNIGKDGPARVFIRQQHSNGNEQPPTFISRTTEKPWEKKGHDSITLDPENIQSVNVIRVGSNMPVPPPGLIEVFLKQKLKGDSNMIITMDSSGKKKITKVAFNGNYTFSYTSNGKDSAMTMEKTKDSFRRMFAVGLKELKGKKQPKDSFFTRSISKGGSASPIIRFLSDSKSINDSIPVVTVDSAFKSELSKSNKKINYQIIFKQLSKDSAPKADVLKDTSKEFVTSNVMIGYTTPYSYQAKFSNIFGFIVQKMGWQISGSFLLLAFVVISFISLYRNLLAQRRLADMKNEFISNITHELKTPIATVSVAIEALKNFGGISSPERTKEYLDISSSELQRLSLLVDKVLKLSMFENREIELKKEPLDFRNLVDEVLNTMKLQFEKHQAIVQLKKEGTNFMINADRLHIVSVLYNLLDNAMKYSKDKPYISIELKQLANEISLQVTDKGIGIPSEYKEKVFEKFFRVPTGNKHNVKGYGLGLSYVYHVVGKHNGSIQVESEEGIGSTFTVKLPTA